MYMKYSISFLVFWLALSFTFGQNNPPEVGPVTKTFAIQKATIVQAPGKIIEEGTIIIKNGLIQAVGKNVSIPSNAKVIDGTSMYVYAGFLDGFSHAGIPKPRADQNQQRGQRGGNQNNNVLPQNPTNEQAGITPEKKVADAISPQDKSIADLRAIGFTTSCVVPRGQMLPGRAAMVLLNGHDKAEAVLSEGPLFAQFAGAGRFYPRTTMAVMSKFRELYMQSKQALNHAKIYEKNPQGVARPVHDNSLKAFYPVIEGKQAVLFKAEDARSIHRAFTLQQELGFSMMIGEVKSGWHLADKIKSTQTPVFLSLELPSDKKKSAKKKDEMTEEEKALEKKRMESMKEHLSQAAVFEKKEIPFGFSAMDVNAKDVKGNLKKMIDNGLSKETALAALTTVPAKFFGLSDVMGSVESGKIANLVVTDQPYFEENSNVRYVLVDGHLHEYEVKKKKKAGEKEKESGRKRKR